MADDLGVKLRAAAFALRDLVEATGGEGGTLDLAGLVLTYEFGEGFHLVPVEGDPLDVTEWVEWTGVVPVEGVVSVREQPALLATAARGD